MLRRRKIWLPPKSVYFVWVRAPDGKATQSWDRRQSELRAVTRKSLPHFHRPKIAWSREPSDQSVLSTDLFRVSGVALTQMLFPRVL
jgi:hypothetical protein